MSNYSLTFQPQKNLSAPIILLLSSSEFTLPFPENFKHFSGLLLAFLRAFLTSITQHQLTTTVYCKIRVKPLSTAYLSPPLLITAVKIQSFFEVQFILKCSTGVRQPVWHSFTYEPTDKSRNHDASG